MRGAAGPGGSRGGQGSQGNQRGGPGPSAEQPEQPTVSLAQGPRGRGQQGDQRGQRGKESRGSTARPGDWGADLAYWWAVGLAARWGADLVLRGIPGERMGRRPGAVWEKRRMWTLRTRGAQERRRAASECRVRGEARETPWPSSEEADTAGREPQPASREWSPPRV